MMIWLSILVQIASAQTITPTFPIEFPKGDLIAKCKAAIAKADGQYKEIQALKPEQRNMDSTYLAAEEISAELSEVVGPFMLMKNVSTSADTRKEAQDCAQALSVFSNDISTRRELYLAMKDQKGRNADEKRLVSERMKGFELDGMKLSDEKLKKFRELNDKLDELSLNFGNNIRNENPELMVTPEELAGVREDYVKSLKKNDKGLLRVSVRETDFFEIEKSATNPETRKKMMLAFYNRAGGTNIKILESALPLRQEIAALLGFKTWADYREAQRMSGTRLA